MKAEAAEKPDRKIYSGIDDIPSGSAGSDLAEGCIVLEGGGWRGLYTLGVLDALMVNDVNIRNAVGISAGALSAIGYIAGEIGWGARIDLKYRHDSDYVGVGAMRRDHGVTGFSHLFTELIDREPFDRKRLNDPSRRLAVGVTNMLTGKTEYMEKGSCNLSAAIRASATVPYVSRPVVIDGIPYLDGGCSTKIPYDWAVSEGFEKIVVVKTREWEYRRRENGGRLANRMYRKYPEFVDAMNAAEADFNRMTDELAKLHGEGKIYAIAPSEPVNVSRFEGDMEKLGALYWLGYNDAKAQIGGIKDYLMK
ncbi:MAG: patatin family protein [Lachnospiraceae bacterium]|nr:patatin family protein [Lachnospiraceae bacterium]